MKEKLLAILDKNDSKLTTAVIIEALKHEDSCKYLLDVEQWLQIDALNSEAKINTFYEKHSVEIEKIKLTLQQYPNRKNVYSLPVKTFYSKEAFKFVAFNTYMTLVIEDL